MEGSRLTPSGWRVGPFEDRRHLQAFLGSRPQEAVVRLSRPRLWEGRLARAGRGGTGRGLQASASLETSPPRPALLALGPQTAAGWSGPGSKAAQMLNCETSRT